MIQLEVEVSGSHLATYVADGVVVATPTGSTAYSFSAGGSILDPRLRNMVVTPVAAYLSPLHSVVAGEDQEVDLTLREAHDGALVSLDGQVDLPMRIGDRVEVRALPEPMRLIQPDRQHPVLRPAAHEGLAAALLRPILANGPSRADRREPRRGRVGSARPRAAASRC